MTFKIPSNFAKHVLDKGGSLTPLFIDPKFTQGTGTTNPSILVSGEDILINVRHVEYTLYHSEKKKYTHPWGPVQYLHRENDLALRTNNFLGIINSDTKEFIYSKVDTSTLDVEPIWEFIGLEDARLVHWDNKLYLSGVRRDTTPNGQGRMELSEVNWGEKGFTEVKRSRIPAPGNDGSYCEKNWMPILDMPYHYVKWCNPTEVVKVDPENLTCETVYLGDNRINLSHDLRGGSQVIPYGDKYRMAITHQVDLYASRMGRKDARYLNRIIVWDLDWNVVEVSEPFDFLGGEVEFACGAAWAPGTEDLMVTFGYQDNSAFLIEIPRTYLDELLGLYNKQQSIPVIGTAIVNGAHWLARLVASVDYPVDEFLIIDNNGRGQLDEQIDSIVEAGNPNIKNFRVCRLPGNIGCPGAWNLIIKSYLTSPYWVIANHDVMFNPGFLEEMASRANDPKVGLIHGSPGDRETGMYDIFLIKDWVVQRFGLFDENFYPGYSEDVDYVIRLQSDPDFSNSIVLSMDSTYLHGVTGYAESGSQTWRTEKDLKDMLFKSRELNEFEYMIEKWGPDWPTNPYRSPFNNPSNPVTMTTFDLNFARRKHLGF